MARGRPFLPEGTQMVSISIRIPVAMRDFYKSKGDMSYQMRVALEEYQKKDTSAVDTVKG